MERRVATGVCTAEETALGVCGAGCWKGFWDGGTKGVTVDGGRGRFALVWTVWGVAVPGEMAGYGE